MAIQLFFLLKYYRKVILEMGNVSYDYISIILNLQTRFAISRKIKRLLYGVLSLQLIVKGDSVSLCAAVYYI